MSLIDHGAAVNYADKNGLTPLNVAIKEERAENLKLLLQNGAKLSKSDLNGNGSSYKHAI